MTQRESILFNLLHQACALISVEANDHADGRFYDDKAQRKRIAKTLREFLEYAEKHARPIVDNPEHLKG